jgi:hypothetical protein
MEKEVIDCMTRALKYLDVELNAVTSDRHTLAKYRAATIHHRLASLLHNAFRTQVNSMRRKHLRALASLHYQKALKLFSFNENPLEYLRLLIEEVAMADYELERQSLFIVVFVFDRAVVFLDANDTSSKMKSSQNGLRASLQCYDCVVVIEKRRCSADADDYNESFVQEAQRLLAILIGRIQAFLKELVKLFKSQSSKKGLYEQYREMYAIALRVNEYSSTVSADLCEAMDRMKKILDKHADV